MIKLTSSNMKVIDLKANNMIEFLGDMDGKELSKFVHALVDQNPKLAENIRSYIQFSFLDKRFADQEDAY